MKLLNKKQKRRLWRIGIGAAATALLLWLAPQGALRLAAFGAVYLFVGYDVLWRALWGLGHGQWMDENFLMTLATLGALVLGATGQGDYTEAVAVMWLYQVGELFQALAVGKSRRAIQALGALRPDVAYLAEGADRRPVDPAQVEPGAVLSIHPGERIPLDGTVLEGRAQLDTSALTGESLPRWVEAGDPVWAGSVNLDGVLRAKVTQRSECSTAARILQLVEGTAAAKAKPERMIQKFAAVYTPAVCLAALGLALIGPLFNGQWLSWLYRALTFLVISCPCALVISIPLTFFAGLGGASRRGILIKGAQVLESLAHCACAVFDKTLTLTQGRFAVTACHSLLWDRALLTERVAHLQAQANHPIAKALTRSYKGSLDLGRVQDFRQIPGCGVSAKVDGVEMLAGKADWLKEKGVILEQTHPQGTVVYVAADGKPAGTFVLEDPPKPQAKAALERLRQLGVQNQWILSGDNPAAVEKTARELGLRGIGNLLPEQKARELEKLLSTLSPKQALLFAGDGINDAPVLARAHVGLAMGKFGTEAAMEAADGVILDDDPQKIATAVAIGQRTLGIAKQNVYLSVLVKLVCLALSAAGLANMWLAVFADVGVMVLAVLNALRALQTKDL